MIFKRTFGDDEEIIDVDTKESCIFRTTTTDMFSWKILGAVEILMGRRRYAYFPGKIVTQMRWAFQLKRIW